MQISKVFVVCSAAAAWYLLNVPPIIAAGAADPDAIEKARAALEQKIIELEGPQSSRKPIPVREPVKPASPEEIERARAALRQETVQPKDAPQQQVTQPQRITQPQQVTQSQQPAQPRQVTPPQQVKQIEQPQVVAPPRRAAASPEEIERARAALELKMAELDAQQAADPNAPRPAWMPQPAPAEALERAREAVRRKIAELDREEMWVEPTPPRWARARKPIQWEEVPPVVGEGIKVLPPSDSEGVRRAVQQMRQKVAELESVPPPPSARERRAAEKERAKAEAAKRAAEKKQAQLEAKARAKAEAEARAKARAEARAKAKSEAEARAKARAEARAKAEAEARAKAEARKQARAAERERTKVEEKPAKRQPAETGAPVAVRPQPAESRQAPTPEAKAAAVKRAEAEARARHEAEMRARERASKEPRPEDKARAAVLAPRPKGRPLAPTFEMAPLPLSAEKQRRLAELLAKYKADLITPEEYHRERARILAEP
ncbi:MAG: hypothetical protein N2379_11095 [Verrucomicrobiae bacterium]|nr:hypothetical protein [Verrucomicrobiae bacterium]